MFLLKIVNKSFFSLNLITQNYTKYLSHKILILKFVKKEAIAFFLSWFTVFILAKFRIIQKKLDYFISYLFFSFFNCQKLINYVIYFNLSPTNTFININSITGNPKRFYSAGMFDLKKKQKTQQPKAIITMLRSFLLSFKNFKIKPVALHFNNLLFNKQSYICKKLKEKIFIKLITIYTCYPHNGCRMKKRKRIKIRTKIR